MLKVNMIVFFLICFVSLSCASRQISSTTGANDVNVDPVKTEKVHEESIFLIEQGFGR